LINQQIVEDSMSELIEANIEEPVCAAAEAAGWVVRKVKWIGRVAAPDRLMARDGEILLVEFKRPGETPRATQVREHKRFADVGVKIHVIDSLEAGLELIK